MSRILYKFASRSRPDKFFAAVDNIYLNSRNKNFLILATLDDVDTTMNNTLVRDRMVHYDKLIPIFGTSKNKIEAYNRDLTSGWVFDILINMSDDMVFIKDGYDIEIERDIMEAFPYMDGLIHYNDGNQGENVITLAIMGKRYYDFFGYIYHPSYQSLWCDCDQMEVARRLKKYKYMGDEKIIFRHMHPSFGRGEMDELYARNEDRTLWDIDERNYRERMARNFDLTPIPA